MELELVFVVQIGIGKDERYKLHLFTLGGLPYIDKKQLPESVLTILICLKGQMVLRNHENVGAVESPK